MVMVKYTLQLRPTVSYWPTLRRQLKLALAFGFVLAVSCVIILGASRSLRIGKLYEVQARLADAFDLEMRYMNERPIFGEDTWLRVNDLDGHIYSAYVDVRPEVIDRYSHLPDEIPWALVRIIAILPTRIDEKRVDCIYKHGNGSDRYLYRRRPVTSMKPIEENWGLRYSAFFVICDLTVPDNFNYDLAYNENQLPESVAIALYGTEAVESDGHTRFVDVRYPVNGMSVLYEQPEKFMAVCVPVLHHSFNRPLDLVEFVEYHLLLGASHFTFYNSSISSEVDRVLRFYSESDIATVLRWELPSNYVFEKTLRYEGMFAGLNDCLYRNAFHDSYKYVANFGVDEFVVPRIHDDFRTMMAQLDPPLENDGANRHASFLFNNVFFYTMYQDETVNKDPNAPYLYTQAKTWRLRKPHPPGQRSRYIVRGLDAVELGSHNVWELRRGSSTFSNQFDEVPVEAEVALSHNYSPCEAEETGCYLKPIEIDRAAHRFTRKLGPRVAATCDKIFGNTGCPVVKKETLA